MAGRKAILCCRNFHPEVAGAVAAEGWTDVDVVEFPARCGRPPLTADELRSLLPADCSQLIVTGRACLGGLDDSPAGLPPTRLLKHGQCFHLVAAPTLVDEAITDGAYLITPRWLAEWPARIAELGFTLETAGEFFRDFAKRLLLLDTGVEPDALRKLDDLAATLGLPAARVAVGLGQVRLQLARVLAEAERDAERRARQDAERKYRLELADHVSAMDLLTRLAQSRSEDDTVAAIEDMFRMLFAPATWRYLPVNGGEPEAAGDELGGALLAMKGDWAWTPSGSGFLLRIARGEQTLGLVAVDGLAFPAFRERYLNLALALSGVCALAIDNARTRRRLLEAEKMASLGILTAGVAHEINTPLGVGLTAVSTLQAQADTLAQHFAERRMTQSELQGYLDTAACETALIRSNLERIGKLVQAFRQVAVAGSEPVRKRFALRALIDDTVAALATPLAEAHATVEVDCDPALELDSIAADWATVLGNLLGNSLRHGFRGREHGRIEIHAEACDNAIVLDYSDDGIGMAEETRRRVFDPFFSTDLQHGMGLGMHLAYNLVSQRLGGSIDCSSAPGQGARFRIKVPL